MVNVTKRRGAKRSFKLQKQITASNLSSLSSTIDLIIASANYVAWSLVTRTFPQLKCFQRDDSTSVLL